MKKFFIFLALFLVSMPAMGMEYTGSKLRDPFVSPDEVVKNPGQKIPDSTVFALQGVVWDSEKPQAIINNAVVSVGSKIESAEVVEITKKGVKLSYNGKEIVLFLKGEQNEKS